MKKMDIRAVGLFVVMLAFLPVIQPAYADNGKQEKLAKESEGFSNQGNTFGKESPLLISNTREVDNTLLFIEDGLNTEHRVAVGLQQLDSTLKAVKNLIDIAKLVPQTRSNAEAIDQKLNTIMPPVSKAAVQAAELDKKLTPIRTKTQKAEDYASKALDLEEQLDKYGNVYITELARHIGCALDSENVNDGDILLTNKSTLAFGDLNKGLTTVNETYAATVAAPGKALSESSKKIKTWFDKLEKIESAVDALQKKLAPLQAVLESLTPVLNKSIGISVPYTCGVEICTKSAPYPCGVKMCKKWGVKYPCGTHTCYQDVPYPCGAKMCSISLSLSVNKLLQTASGIEAEVEKIVGSVTYKLLKASGLGFINDWKKQAENAVGSVVNKLDPGISISLPDTDMSIDANLLKDIEQSIDKLIPNMEAINKKLDLKSEYFASPSDKIKNLSEEIAKTIRCGSLPGAAAATAPPEEYPQRFKWRMP